MIGLSLIVLIKPCVIFLAKILRAAHIFLAKNGSVGLKIYHLVS